MTKEYQSPPQYILDRVVSTVIPEGTQIEGATTTWEQKLALWYDGQNPLTNRWFIDRGQLYPKISQEQLREVADHFHHWMQEGGVGLSETLTTKEAALRKTLLQNGTTDFARFDQALNVLYFSEIGITRKGLDPVSKQPIEFATHQLEVAQILADEGINDPILMTAAIIHDAIEDTTPLKDPTSLGSIRLEEIKGVFGQDIADIVDLLSKVKAENDRDMNAETQKKIFESLINDPRAVLIKMADRLHSLRTIKGLPDDKQKDKAQETLEIYVPLAKKLGLHQWYREMARIALEVLYGERRVKQIKDNYIQLYPPSLMQEMRGILGSGSDLYKEIPLVDGKMAGLNLEPLNLELHYEENGQDHTNIQNNDYPVLGGVLLESRGTPYDFSTYVYQILRRLSRKLDLPGGFRIKDDIAIPSDADEKGLFYYTVGGEGGRQLVFEFATEEYFERYSASLLELYKGDDQHKKGHIAQLATKNLEKLQGDFARVSRVTNKLVKERSAKDVVEEFKDDLKYELITVTDKSGRRVTFPKGVTVLDLASDIGKPLCHSATGATFTYPDNTKVKVNLDEPLIDGVNVEVHSDGADFVDAMLPLRAYKGMLARFSIAKTYKAKELIAQRLRQHMQLEASNLGYTETGTVPVAGHSETPLINHVRERGKDLVKKEVGRRLKKKNIWPGRLLINGRMLEKFGAQFKNDGTIVPAPNHKLPKYWDFLEQVGLDRIVIGGRRNSFIEGVVREMIRVQNNLVRVNIKVPDIVGVASDVYTIFKQNGCNLLYEEGREDKVLWDEGKLIAIISAKDAEKLDGPEGIIQKVQSLVLVRPIEIYKNKLGNFQLERNN